MNQDKREAERQWQRESYGEDDHIPVPLAHTPRVECMTEPGSETIALYESGSMDAAFIRSNDPVELEEWV